MGNELCCSKQQDMFSDIKIKSPEQNILNNYPNTKNNESFDDKDELNIIENVKTNKKQNNIEQSNTKSIIIQNDEFMYEKFDSKTNTNAKINKIIEDKNGPQDKMEITDIENNKNENNEKNEIDIPEDTNEINEVYNNNLKNNNINIKDNETNRKFNNVVIDENKIIISYISKEKIKINLEENYFKNNGIIKENEINDKKINKSLENSLNIDLNKDNNNKDKNIESNNNIKVKVEYANYDNNNNINNLISLLNNENYSNINDKIQINTGNVTQNGSLFENINYTLDNNIQASNIFEQKETNNIQINESNNIKNNNNNSLSEININQTFFPKATNNNSNYNTTSDSGINNLYLTSNNNNQEIQTTYTNENNNNLDEYTKILNNTDNSTYTNSSNLNNYDYLFNSKPTEKPLFTDKEIDEMIKQAETNYNKTISHNNAKRENYYPIQQNKQATTIINNYPYTNLHNNYKILTPEKKKYTYPLTPDYKIRRSKNNDDIFYYDINTDINNNKYSGKKSNINYINYPSTTVPQQQIKQTPINYVGYTNYNYTPIKYESPAKSNNKYIIYSSPTNENTNLKYILNQPKNQTKTIIQNPVKYSTPIIQYNYNTKAINNPKNIIYNTVTGSSLTNKNNYGIPVDTNIYQPKKLVNSSLINTSYLNQIQKMNKTNDLLSKNNKYIISSLSSSNSANRSFSSSSSSPTKYDKNGNPYYITSLHSSDRKLKYYQNSVINNRLNKKYRSLSNDDASRKKGLNEEYFNDISSYESPLSTPRKNVKINYNLNSMKPINTNQKKNVKINQDKLYSKKNVHINNTKNYKNYKSIYPSYNTSTIKSIKDDQLIDIDEHTKQIIRAYSSMDMTSTNNFYPDNYKLFFYSYSPQYSQVPQSEIYTRKMMKYLINNDPSKEAIYTGGFNYNNQRHGLGQLKEPNCLKIGTWKNGEFSGWGRVIYNNGQAYEGKFTNGKLNGKGVYKYKDALYVGDFSNFIRQGKGVLMNNKFRYIGQFNMGKIDGYGKIIFYEDKEGEGEYEGFFKNNNIEGKGIMKWKNGNVYEGDMKNGKMNGVGRFIPAGGIPIKGVFKNNVKVNYIK